MALVTVFVCGVSLDTVQRRAISKREEESPPIFKEEKSVRKRGVLKSHGHAEAFIAHSQPGICALAGPA